MSQPVSKHLENLSPEEFLIGRLHQCGELNLVGARLVYCHLVLVTVHLRRFLPTRYPHGPDSERITSMW